MPARTTRGWLLALPCVVLCTLTCHSPTEPNSELSNEIFATVHLQNAAGNATITGAEALLNGIPLETDTPSATADQRLLPLGPANEGSNTLTILLTAQTTGAMPTAYRVPRFNLTLTACVGNQGGQFVFADDGGLSRTFHMAEQSGNLVAGQGFSYTFYSPRCVPEGNP